MKVLLRLFFSLLGIFLVSGFPILLTGLLGGELLFAEYFKAIKEVIKGLWPVQDITVFNSRIQQEMPVFPNILKYISYSLQILFLAFGAAAAFALTFTVLTMLLKERGRERVKLALYFLESLPDLLIIMLAQLVIIFLYKQTGVLLSSIAVTGDNRIYWLPVFCLSLLPMIQLYRLCMLTFQVEERQMYVELAHSLGFTKTFIVLIHMFRNAIISVFFQSKKTVWFMLSNLFVLELMFNLPGIMLFLRDNMTPQVFILTIFSFFLPIFFFYNIGEWFFLRRLRGKEVL